jgi:hypothetical protein
MQVVMPYARHLLSGVARPFGDEPSPVLIAPRDEGHQLMLRSSQPNTEPLTLQLDDAELADLVRCLDLLRNDARVLVPFDLPQPQPLRRRELLNREPLRRRLAAPLVGVGALLLAGLVAWMVPLPKAPPASPAPVATPAKPG